jgi:hypothetical protein
MGQIYQSWWRKCREIILFFILEYCIFYVLYPFVIYLLNLPRIFGGLDTETIQKRKAKMHENKTIY